MQSNFGYEKVRKQVRKVPKRILTTFTDEVRKNDGNKRVRKPKKK